MPTGNAHDDLLFELGPFTHVCDSYYLALDSGVRPGDESSAKVRAVLVGLLDQWTQMVAGLAVEETCYLPFDFSDQCIAWLRVTRIDPDSVELLPVWSSDEAYCFNPSDYGAIAANLRETGRMEEAVSRRMSRVVLLQDIAASRAEADEPSGS